MRYGVWLAQTAEHDLSGVARQLLTHAVGFAPMLAYEPSGKPVPAQAGWHFSLAHTRGAVVCAVSDRVVGVDVEHVRAVSDRVVARVFTAREQALAGVDARKRLEIWTRKEALIKRTGQAGPAALAEVDSCAGADLSTIWVDPFVLSVCGMPPGFELHYAWIRNGHVEEIKPALPWQDRHVMLKE